MTNTPPAPTVVGIANQAPCPLAQITITPMPTDAVTVTVWRSYAGSGGLQVVRGANAAKTSGDFYVVDYEVPVAIPVTYVCQTFDASNVPSQVSNASSAVTVNSTSSWWMDALNPSSAVEIKSAHGQPEANLWMMAGSFDNLTYAQDVSVNPVFGTSTPWAAATLRQDPSNLTVRIRAKNASAASAFQSVLSAFPVCIRIPPRVLQAPDLMYVAFPTAVAAPRISDGVTTWTMQGQCVQGPGISVVLAVRSYLVAAAQFSTYSSAAAAYSTYTAAQKG